MTIEELLAATGLTANDLVPIYDAEAAQNVEPTQKITAAQFAAAVKVLADLQGKLTFDSTPTTGSTNPVTSGGVADAIEQSTASSHVAWSATGITSGNIYLARSGKVRVMSFEDVVVPAGSSFSITAVPVGDRPAFLSVGSLFAGNGACASIWVRTSGTFGSGGAIGHTLNGSLVWIAAQ